MTAGELRDRISIQRKTEQSDGAGGSEFVWAAITGLASIRGAFRPERGNERIDNGRLTSSVAGTLKIRSSSASRGIVASDRAIINGDAYAIHSVTNPDRRNKYIELTVERGGSGT